MHSRPSTTAALISSIQNQGDDRDIHRCYPMHPLYTPGAGRKFCHYSGSLGEIMEAPTSLAKQTNIEKSVIPGSGKTSLFRCLSVEVRSLPLTNSGQMMFMCYAELYPK